MESFFFYLFAVLAVISAFLVIANPVSRSPVTSAMFLVLTMVSLAGLFVLLHAFFLAAVQILVYAGAVMVLFLFVVMLLDLSRAESRKFSWFSFTTGIIAVGALGGVIVAAIVEYGAHHQVSEPVLEGTTEPLGRLLFSSYLLPFEVLSVVLLAAMVGVIFLSKKDPT